MHGQQNIKTFYKYFTRRSTCIYVTYLRMETVLSATYEQWFDSCRRTSYFSRLCNVQTGYGDKPPS